MVFVHNCIPIHRFLLAIVLHPNDDHSIEQALYLLGTLIKKFPHFSQRIHNYCSFAPLYSNHSNAKSEDFFTKLADYYKKYPEFTYLEMYKRTTSAEKYAEPFNEKHLPIYYDVMPERIWPISRKLMWKALAKINGSETMKIKVEQLRISRLEAQRHSQFVRQYMDENSADAAVLRNSDALEDYFYEERRKKQIQPEITSSFSSNRWILYVELVFYCCLKQVWF